MKFLLPCGGVIERADNDGIGKKFGFSIDVSLKTEIVSYDCYILRDAVLTGG